MKILVINSGSSSLKYKLFDMNDEKVKAKGNCQRIGIDGFITHQTDNNPMNEYEIALPSHSEALQEVFKLLSSEEQSVIENLNEISAVGHRIVHGADKFNNSVQVTETVLSTLEQLSEIAPLHNPPAIQAIRDCQSILGTEIPQVCVFDTSFHATIPLKAYTYPIPYDLAEKYNIRRYGFHGISLRYICLRLSQILDKSLAEMKIVACHLGNGVSVTAIDQGCSVDTTMGFTPLSGIIMGTRCGDIDPSIITFLQRKEKLTFEEIDDILNTKSGFLGVSGLSSNPFYLSEAVKTGDKQSELALQIQSYQVKKHIGAYVAAMGGLDAVIITGGLGERSASVRERILGNMEILGIEFDRTANEICKCMEQEITVPSSRVKVFVIPTDEELMIARDMVHIIRNQFL